MLRKLLMSAAFAGLSTATMAADLPNMKGPAPFIPAAPIFTWTGFYVGLNAGYNWSDNNSINSVGTATFASPAFLAGSTAVANGLAIVGTNTVSGKQQGFIGGAQLGYNWQFNSIVLGIETDLMGLGNSSKNTALARVTPVPGFGETYTSVFGASKKTEWLGTLRGRIGFLATPSFLLYATGGLAYGGIKVSHSVSAQESLGPAVYPPVNVTASTSKTAVGWALGAGADWKVTQSWSVRAEYLYYDLGKASVTSTWNQICVACGGGFVNPGIWAASRTTSTARFNGQIARLGVNFHF